MTKMMTALMVMVVAATGCAARPAVTASPAQRAEAIRLYIGGASSAQVASELAMEPHAARELIHTTIVDLNRQYYRRR